MPLLITPIDNILIEVRDILQDQQKSRWLDPELYRYLNQGQRDLAIRTKYNHINHTIDVVESDVETEFDLPAEAIEFHHIYSVQPYTIPDPTTITFPNSQEESVVVDYYAYPVQIVYGVTTELQLEQDLIDALVQYVLYKSYLKEDTPEDFRKSQYFQAEYRQIIARIGGRWDGQFDIPPHKSDFYTG